MNPLTGATVNLVNAIDGNDVVTSLIRELERACEIADILDDNSYGRTSEDESSIGAHIRHNLEFVNELLNGIAERRVDYSARRRDVRIELDRLYAIEQITFACERLENLTVGVMASLVMVRSEVDCDVWHTSSVSREIEFLHSHTVHHYALIAGRITDAGFVADAPFGVAPSTLRYRESIEQERDSFAAATG